MLEEDAKIREDASLVTAEPFDPNDLAPPPPSTGLTQRRITSFGYEVTPGSRRQTRGATTANANASDGDNVGDTSDDRSGVDTPCPPSNKRKRDALQDEEFELSDLSSDEEKQLAALADAKLDNQGPQASAPPGVSITPAITRTTDRVGGLPTPSVARTLFQDPNARSSKRKRSKTVSFKAGPDPTTTPTATAASSATLAASSSDTPTKSKSTENPPSPSTTNNGSPSTTVMTPSTHNSVDGDVTNQVVTLLRSQKVEPAVLSSINQLLETSARKAKGLTLARDSVRSASREKDLEIAKLQQEVTKLENKNRTLERQITGVKARAMDIYSSV